MHFIKLCCTLFLLIFSGISGNSTKIDDLPAWKYLPKGKECGLTKFDDAQNNIIDGEKAALGQFPWIVRAGFLGYKKSIFICGGSLLNTKYVLTAAHCGVIQIVRAGENNINTEIDCEGDLCAPPHQDVKVKKQSFTDFDPASYKNDISLILLETPVKYNEFVVPICLPRGKMLPQDFTGAFVYVAGWGSINGPTKKSTSELMYTVLPIINPSKCNNVYPEKLPPSQYCIGYDHGKDTCSGDSGGPLTKSVNMDGIRKSYVLAIVSYGLQQCGKAPAVYTNVSYYLEWILENIEES